MADLVVISDYLLDRNPQAAERVFHAILVAGDRLDLFPHRGRLGRLFGTREIVASRSYVLVYRVSEHEVIIERVWHSAQSRGQ